MTTRLALATLAVTLAAQPPAASHILAAKCLACHGATQMSGLDIRTAESLKKGGSRGPAVVPGNAEASLLFQAITRSGPLKMPPGANALSPAEIDSIKSWINAGARLSSLQPASQWWSFRKPLRPATPQSQHPIDALLKTQAPPASKAALARRAFFDLHGLPPSPAELDQFLSDTSPNAWPSLIDRLLASPRYGERWGRYWLDLVRYADTAGFETDHFFINAWRYRDYVIAAFNADKPPEC